MSIKAYQEAQNASDSSVQLSTRAVRSILLYCRDWSDRSLSKEQKMQSVKAGQTLCDAMVMFMNNALPEKEQRLLMTIFTKTSHDLFECELGNNKTLFENERALIKILDILEKKSTQKR